MTSIQTIPLFIAANKITAAVKRIPARAGDTSDWSRDATHWEVVILHGNRSFTTQYSQGSAHKGRPDLASVLECLQSDISSVVNAKDFEDWASDLGYDTDSRKAEAIYRACTEIGLDVQRLLGAALYAEFLACEEA